MYKWICSLCVAILSIGCSSTPGGVLSQDEMAQLLVDIHIGESVIEANRENYDIDSVKKALKQSIYIKHNVTQEQVDTSFVWYGQNIEKYIEVYDEVIAMLEDDIRKVKVSADNMQFVVAGDSADAWPGLRCRLLTALAPDKSLSFSINSDENWEAGDVYEWKLKLLNNQSTINWTIAVDYTDGSSEYKNLLVSQDGWQDITLYCDSTKMPSRVYGVALADIKSHERIHIDSISLIRTRLNPQLYRRRYSQQSFECGTTHHGKE